MPCDTRLKTGQTIQQRAAEIRTATDKIAQLVANGFAKVKISPQGAIAFDGIPDADRDGVTDACAYRRLLATGSALALAKIAQAEMLAGRAVDKRVIGQGVHAHSDGKGGLIWHDHKG